MKKKPVYAPTFGSKASEVAEKIIEEAKISGRLFNIPLSMIEPAPFHDRSGYSGAAIDELAANIQSLGQLQPIVVRQLSNGKYQRIAGFRRIEAFKKLDKKEIEAVVLTEISDADAYLIMISENVLREPLNAYDEVSAIMEYLSRGIGMSVEATQSFLVRAENAKAGVVKNFSQEEEEKLAKLESLLSKLGKYTIGSFVKNKLSILKMPQILVDALVSRKLDYSQAKVINLLRDYEDEMNNLVERANSEKLSKRELQEIVSDFLLKHKDGLATNKNSSPKQKAIAYAKIGATVKKTYSKLPEEKQKEVDALFAKLEKLIRQGTE